MITQFIRRGMRLLPVCVFTALLLASTATAKNIGADPPAGSSCATCNCAHCNSRPSVSVPSNTSTSLSRTEGNLTEQVPISSTQSASGPTVNLRAVYNSYNADGSRANVDTVMGYGWTHSYNIFLFSQFGAMFRYDGAGRVTKFGLGPGGTYVTATGYFETLTKAGSNYALTQNDQTVYTFSSIPGTPFSVGGPVWRVTQIVDRNGNHTTFTYSAGNLTTIADTYGRTTQFTYNAQHKIATVTDSAGRVTTFTYDSTGHKLTAIADPNGHTIQYTYDSLYHLTGKTDRDGRTFSYSYSNGEPVSVQDGGGNSSATMSNGGNWPTDPSALASAITRTYVPGTTQVTDGRGNTWTYQYEAHGYLTSIAAPDGATVRYTYDPNTLQIASMVDANNNTTTYSYDAQGNLTQKTDALGHTTTYTYNSTFNVVTSMTDPRGRVTTYIIDPATGNRTKETDPLGNSNSWTYDAHGNVLTATDKDGHTTTNQYDTAGNILKVTDPLGNTTTATYDGAGNRLSATDADGHTTTYQYDGLNRLIKETDALNHSTATTYDAEGNRIQVTDRNGHTTSYQYDLRQRLVKTTDAVSQSETSIYDGNDNRLTVKDRDGHTATFGYDVQNRMTSVTDAAGDISTTTYDPYGNALSATDANGHKTVYTYDALNRRVTTTDAASEVTTNQYDTGTLSTCPTCGAIPGSAVITGKTDANSNVTYYKYDAINRLIDVVRKVGSAADTITAADAVTVYAYDGFGNRLSLTEPDGNTETWTYDADNRVVQQVNAAGDTTTMAYDPVGNTLTVTAPNLNVTTNTYDAINRLITVTDSGGALSSYTWDNERNRVSETDGNGNTTHYAYDALDRPTTVTDALGSPSTTAYDAVGNILTSTDRNSNITQYSYDAVNRRVKLTDALGNITQWQYDPVGNRTAMTDPNSHSTSYSYDAVNRLLTETYADGGVRSLAYDGVGNVLTRTDQLGRITNYSYNPLYFLLGRSYPSGINDTYAYDLSGRMLTGQRGAWTDTFTYDGANRLTQTNQNGQIISYVYNVPGRTRQVTYPGGRVITEYTDARTRTDHIADPSSSAAIVQYAYDAGNRVTARTYRNGTAASYTYNADNWTTNIQHSLSSTPIAGFSYAYDNEANRLYENKLSDPAHSEAYQYDSTYRLITYKVGTLVGSTVPVPLTQTSYTLDPVGNPVNQVTNGVPQTRSYNPTNEVLQIGSQAVTYDGDGNTGNDGAYSYAYDEENRLTSVTRLSDSAVAGQYLYDALSRRVQTVADPNGAPSTTSFYYDTARVIEEQSGGATLATYVYGNYIDELLTMDRGGQPYYYHQSSRWSVEAVTDHTGTAVERYSYDAYGAVTITPGGGGSPLTNIWGTPHSAIGNRYLFTGREFDEESGLYYYRSRFYDTAKERFLVRDSAEYEDGPNLYSYVQDNPINRLDPDGMKAWWEQYNYLCCREWDLVRNVLAKFKLTANNQNCTCRDYMLDGFLPRSVLGGTLLGVPLGVAGWLGKGKVAATSSAAGVGLGLGLAGSELIAYGYCESYWCSDFYVPTRTTVVNPARAWYNAAWTSRFLATYTCNRGGNLFDLSFVRYSEAPHSWHDVTTNSKGGSYTVGESNP